MTSEANFAISAFGDEIATDLKEQLQVLNDLRIGYLELRAAWGTNVLHLDDDQVAGVGQTCDQYNVAVSSIGSPVGKSPILDPIENELNNLQRLFQVAEAVGTRRVRVFSFYPPDRSSNAHYDEYLPEATSRLARMTELAQRDGFTLMLENEKGIVGDTLARCHALVSAIDNPHLRFLWDPANFVQVNEKAPTTDGWSLLGPYVGYVHIKDAIQAGGGIRPAGEGDGQVGELLSELREAEYQGFLALEPHLAVAGHSSGFSGAKGMARAVGALRKLMAQHNCAEVPER